MKILLATMESLKILGEEPRLVGEWAIYKFLKHMVEYTFKIN